MATLKLKALIRDLENISHMIDALRAQGIDVDQIVTISNAQGRPVKVLHDLLMSALQTGQGIEFHSPVTLPMQIPKRVGKSIKKKQKKISP
jgi:hypothetical protein